MDWYINWVTHNPLVSAMIQFAILGTLGDSIARKFIGKKIKPISIPFKMIEWVILAICIKYAFTGGEGFVKALVEKGYLPDIKPGSVSWAFFKSVFINLQFGFFLVIFHRLLDNIVDQASNWKNLHKGFFSLIWFWIPAHTLTFSLDKPFQIGLAALWSVVLGIILGLFNRKR